MPLRTLLVLTLGSLLPLLPLDTKPLGEAQIAEEPTEVGLLRAHVPLVLHDMREFKVLVGELREQESPFPGLVGGLSMSERVVLLPKAELRAGLAAVTASWPWCGYRNTTSKSAGGRGRVPMGRTGNPALPS